MVLLRAGRFFLLCVGVLLALGARLAVAQPFEPSGPYTHPQSQLVFPETLGGMPRASAFNYESRSPGLGVSVKYRIDDPIIFADIYVFNQGMPIIPEGTSDPSVNRMMENAITEIRRMGELGRYEDVSFIGMDSIPLGEATGARRAMRARFSYTLTEGPVYSHVYGLAVHNHFVKMRFTYRQDQAAQALPILAATLRDLGTIVGENLQ